MVAQSGYAVADQLGSDVELRREPLASIGDPVAVRRDSQIRRAPNSSGLYDILDLILDKGIVIDAFVRVSLVGIELLTVDLRIVIASVDTYLRYAEGVERLQVHNRSDAKKLPDVVGGGMRAHAMKKGAQKLSSALGVDDNDNDDEGEGRKEGLAGALTKGVRHVLQKGVGGILHNVKGDAGDEDDDRGEEEDREEREPARERSNGNRDRAKAGARR